MDGSSTPSAIPDSGWLQLSARLQRLVAKRSGRTDVVVRIAPHEVSPSAWNGGYRHDIAEVLLDSRAYIASDATDLADLDPTRADARADHAALLGACCVAAAHAAHTGFDPPGGEAAMGRVVAALERARVCATYLREHPADRLWIRASVGASAHADIIEAFGFLALAKAAVVSQREVEPARLALVERLDERVVEQLQGLCGEAVGLPDGCAEALVELAASAADLMGVAAASFPQGAGSAAPDDGDDRLTGVAQVQREVVESVDRLAHRRLHRQVMQQPDSVDAAMRANARAAARITFGRQGGSTATTLREPDEHLRRHARNLASAIRRARYRAPAVTTRSSAVPPGRVTLAEVMRRDAQRAARATLTAKPWRQRIRREVDQPPLRVGLSWDISSSMMAYHRDMADLAWALAWAMLRSSGLMAAVAWNRSAHPVVWPGEVPSAVREPRCGGGSTGCPASLRALDGVLDLAEGSGARLLIITTDHELGHRRLIDDQVAHLTNRGVRTIWITPTPDPRTPPGAMNMVARHGRGLSLELTDVICSTLKEFHA